MVKNMTLRIKAFSPIHLNKEYKVEVNGVAKLKKDAEKDFLKDKTMHLQLLFGQANRQDEPNDKKSNECCGCNIES